MQLFVDQALDGKEFWDFCCDHGYIGIGALESKRFSHVHFVDPVKHIMERLEQLIQQAPESDKLKYSLHVKKGEEIESEVKGTAVIAGVGGLLITLILKALKEQKKLSAEKVDRTN